MTYVIRDWNLLFEVAGSVRYKKNRWVAIPNKHDGRGYRRIANHEDNVKIFCAWNLIVQIASKMPVRGILADRDGDLDAEDMADMTGYPKEIFEIALDALIEPKIGWMESVNYEDAHSVLGERPQHVRGEV